MEIMDRLSRQTGAQKEAPGEPRTDFLAPEEIRLIMDGLAESLIEFAASARLHATDTKGETPLHLAARKGSLVLCDLFIRAGSDARLRNHEGMTPADVALAEGHSFVAQLLFSLIENPQDTRPQETFGGTLAVEANAGEKRARQTAFIDEAEPAEQIGGPINLDELLTFEPERSPEDFVDQSFDQTASGTFAPLANPPLTTSIDGDADWEVDLSPAQIAGDGISAEATITPDLGDEHDFLKVRRRGPQSIKRAVMRSGTRLSIDPEACLNWATDILEKRCYSSADMETLISFCKGNGDAEELRFNLQRTLEAAGLELLDDISEGSAFLWDFGSDISCDELADAIEAAFTRATRLPGIQRFRMDKADEAKLLEPMVRAKQELQLNLLACRSVVEAILEVIDRLRQGSTDPGYMTLRTIIPDRPDHAETADFFGAADALKHWYANGGVMDGKRRRDALQALEALDLSLMFYKEIVKVLAGHESNLEDAVCLDRLIATLEAATERLIIRNLPYARRIAARNVEDGEDPEDVFQVAFMGLQRSTRRFDPDRGDRFTIYATFWMKQAITRWRADEGATIRVPVHRHERLASLDQALQKLDWRYDSIISDDELAAELEVSREEVRKLRQIPRQAMYPESVEEWEEILPEAKTADALDEAETRQIVANALEDLEERQADVVRKRFGIGLDDEMTLEEVGLIYGVTRERIRQIEANALRQLASPGRKRRLQTLLGI